MIINGGCIYYKMNIRFGVLLLKLIMEKEDDKNFI